MGDTARRLAGNVTVGGRTYGPDDDLPDEVAAQIRNPKAWRSEQEEAAAAARPEATPAGTSSGARLAGNVTVGGRAYGPGDPVPDEVAAQITNPKAWEGGRLPDLGKAKAAASAAPSPSGDGPQGDAGATSTGTAPDNGVSTPSGSEDPDTGGEKTEDTKARRKR